MSSTQTTAVEQQKVHPTSEAGFGEGKAELYDAVRPSYPPEVLSYIHKDLAGKDKLNVVEIASGSGKFTRSLLGNSEWNKSIAELKCIEPNEGMRSVFSKTVYDTRVSLSNGTFDDTGVPDSWADLIVIATAFHWCLQLEAAVEEFIRILKPDGFVCFLWNRNDQSGAAWVEQAHDFLLPKHNAFSKGEVDIYRWRQIFELPGYKENFTVPEATYINYTEPATLEKVIARFMTWSGIALLSDEEKEEAKEQIRGIIEKGDGLVWINKERGIFEVPFTVPIVTFRRIPTGISKNSGL